MAHVELAIGGRTYSIACRAGGEEHLRALALRVDEKVAEARGSVGTTNESRQLLFAALLLADDVAANVAAKVAEPVAAPPTDDSIAASVLAEMLDGLASRLEHVADLLDEGGGDEGGRGSTDGLEPEGKTP